MSNSTKSYIVRDSISGDEIRIIKDICGRCGNVIDSQNQHTSCRRAITEEQANERERIRRNQSLSIFGEILNINEYMIRMYPSDSYQGQETYNKRLVRQAEEEKAAHYKKLADRDARKQRLPYLEQQVLSLRRQIERDANEEAEEEAKKSQEQQTK
jgi:hypothetical protein